MHSSGRSPSPTSLVASSTNAAPADPGAGRVPSRRDRPVPSAARASAPQTTSARSSGASHGELLREHPAGARRLGGRHGGDAVERRRRRPEAPGSEGVTERGQHAGDGGEQPGVLGGRARAQLLLGVGPEQDPPVLRVGGRPVLLAQHGAGRQVDQARRDHPQARPGERWLSAFEAAPGQVLTVGAALVQAAEEPLGEGQGAGPDAQQLVAQLTEAAAVAGELGLLLGRRTDDVDEVAHQRHLAAHDGVGQGHLDVRAGEQPVVDGAGLVAEVVGGRRRQPDDDGLVAQRRDERRHERAPGVEQVRALVDDERPRPEPGRPVDELAAAGVQQRQQVGALEPADGRPAPLGQRAVGAVLDVLVVSRAVPGAERLVAQDRDGRAQVGGPPGRHRVGTDAAERVPGPQPLGLHRGARHQHERPATEAAHGLEPDGGLAGAGREHDVRAAVGEPLERLLLRRAQGERRGAPLPGVAATRGGLRPPGRAHRRLVSHGVVWHRDILPDRRTDPSRERVREACASLRA